MGLTPLKGLLFLSGAVVAGLGAAYVLGAFDTQEPRPAALSIIAVARDRRAGGDREAG